MTKHLPGVSWKIPSLQEYQDRVREGIPRKGGKRLPSSNTMPRPLISIITVTFNAGSTLERTLLSVPSHDPSLVEHIIIDGNSMDGTLSLLEKHSERIDLWISEPDRGIYDAMNKGLALANGEWILFLNADDYLAGNEIVERIAAEYLLRNDYDIVMGETQYFSGVRMLQVARSTPELIGKELCINHTSTFARRSLFASLGLYTLDFKVISDNEWFNRASLALARIKTVDSIISYMNLEGFSDRRWIQAYSELHRMRVAYGMSQFRSAIMITFQILRTFVRRSLQRHNFHRLIAWYRNRFSRINRHA